MESHAESHLQLRSALGTVLRVRQPRRQHDSLRHRCLQQRRQERQIARGASGHVLRGRSWSPGSFDDEGPLVELLASCRVGMGRQRRRQDFRARVIWHVLRLSLFVLPGRIEQCAADEPAQRHFGRESG